MERAHTAGFDLDGDIPEAVFSRTEPVYDDGRTVFSHFQKPIHFFIRYGSGNRKSGWLGNLFGTEKFHRFVTVVNDGSVLIKKDRAERISLAVVRLRSGKGDLSLQEGAVFFEFGVVGAAEEKRAVLFQKLESDAVTVGYGMRVVTDKETLLLLRCRQ